MSVKFDSPALAWLKWASSRPVANCAPAVAFGPVSACPEVCVALIIWAPDVEVWVMLKVWVLVCDWLTDPANDTDSWPIT